jgi:hypothetical protein
MPQLTVHPSPSSPGKRMQTHYGFIYSTEFGKKLKTPLRFKNQFTIYSHNDKYSRKQEVEGFLKSHYSSIPYSHVMIARTLKPHKLAGDFVIPSRNNIVRFLNLLRVIKPNNSFLKFEAFHTGRSFQSSTLHESDEAPHFLSIKKDSEIKDSDIQLLNKCMNRIKRLKIDQQHRVNNFFGYLEYSVKGPINNRIIWIFISLESLFHLSEEHRDFAKKLCKRSAFFLEPSDNTKIVKIYNLLLRAYKLRGSLVHGGVVDYKKINKTVTDLEPLMWRIGRYLLVEDRKWLKLFSSIDPELGKYFKKADALIV